MGYNKMTIKDNKVFALKSHWNDNNLGGGNKQCFYLPFYASVRFSGCFQDCLNYIRDQGAEYMAEGFINA